MAEDDEADLPENSSELQQRLIIFKQNRLGNNENLNGPRNALPDMVYNEQDTGYQNQPMESPSKEERTQGDSIDKDTQHQKSSNTDEDEEASKRFNEFVGKRSVLSLRPNFNYISDQQSKQLPGSHRWRVYMSHNPTPDLVPFREMSLEQFKHLPAPKREMVSKFVNNFYRVMLMKSTPKRQYDFVGKRPFMAGNKISPELQELFSKRYNFIGKRNLDDLLSKRYDFLGKRGLEELLSKRYDFLGKRGLGDLLKRYDFLGKRGLEELLSKKYDFLGKRSLEDPLSKRYDFLGKKSFGEFLSKKYDFLGKKSFEDILSKRYDFLGKKNLENLLSKKYDFIGKRGYNFLGKKSNGITVRNSDGGDQGKRTYDYLGKKSYDFLGKRYPVEFKIAGDKDQNDEIHSALKSKDKGDKLVYPFQNIANQNSWGKWESKRYSEWVGKRKRTMEIPGSVLPNEQSLAALLQNNTLRKRLSQMLLHSRMPASNTPEFIGRKK